MHHFATPLRPAQQTNLSRNRNHDGASPQDKSPDDATDHPQPDVQSAPLYNRWEREQRRVAGLSADDAFPVPAPPFPHAPLREPRPKFTSARVQQELAGLSPALYAHAASSKDGSVASKAVTPALRTSHLNVLTTVMHRCLLEGDYQRASRAWGMILRTQAHGTRIEPRYNGLWGLGAELLLRRKSGDAIFGEGEQDGPLSDDYLYSEEGFQLAKDYYERLILQYPVRNFQPHAIDATTFYPPLFSVWIMQVLERSRRTRRQLKRAVRRSFDASMALDADDTTTPEGKRTQEARIQHEELAGAREICRRLEELVQSPPYDKSAQLLVLRGHVGLWVSDLLLGKTVTLEPDDESDYGSDSDEQDVEVDPTEMSTKRAEGVQQVKEAKTFFEQAIKLEKEASDSSAFNLEKELRDITKRLAELGNPHR
ncbi:hypothetical protein P171DRAFT_491773 [Karstenula rhodostoma CBS 690.94]|uniref:Uncharacterized protein n=1 Tax=Karstenula rhodostoma CBS 690.94 TaxID=1392251 RepID=A0A9P4P6U3_9PLEO|nr:hypothetical protein P171DRAFT_491773 [Karstenula rhodostoma CBS 690.94]